MPIYEYRCGSCGAELEKLQKISEPALLECPECGKESLVKMISASSFRLKGSGWYETDFKTGKKKNGAESAPAESAGGGSREGAGQDAGSGAGSGSKEKSGNSAAESGSAKGHATSAASESKGSKASPPASGSNSRSGKTASE